eukprot:3938710-Lingulodinium_polyedra.AAC.1
MADAPRGHPSPADCQNGPSDEETTDTMEATAESLEPPADSRGRPPGLPGESRATVVSRGTPAESSGI